MEATSALAPGLSAVERNPSRRHRYVQKALEAAGGMVSSRLSVTATGQPRAGTTRVGSPFEVVALP